MIKNFQKCMVQKQMIRSLWPLIQGEWDLLFWVFLRFSLVLPWFLIFIVLDYPKRIPRMNKSTTWTARGVACSWNKSPTSYIRNPLSHLCFSMAFRKHSSIFVFLYTAISRAKVKLFHSSQNILTLNWISSYRTSRIAFYLIV